YNTRVGKSGNSVFSPVRRATNIFGVDVRLIPLGGGEFGITKRDAQRALVHKRGIKARQARAAVSSYTAEVRSDTGEPWALPYARLNEPRFGVNSFQNRVLEHVDSAYDSRVKNGRKGGRPPKTDQNSASNLP
ncbi:MAG: hypothetical protein ACREVJ_04595, partial [Gammaproteobacteria bacterium]